MVYFKLLKDYVIYVSFDRLKNVIFFINSMLLKDFYIFYILVHEFIFRNYNFFKFIKDYLILDKFANLYKSIDEALYKLQNDLSIV